MLADEVIALPSQPDAMKWILPPQRYGYAALAQDVLQAERFVLQRETVFLIHSVAQVPPSRLIPAMQICRMPYPRMWVEFIYKDRDDWHEFSKVQRNGFGDASSPSRLGYYIEQQDSVGRNMVVTLVWRHNQDRNLKDRAIVIGGFALTINTTEHVEISEETRQRYWHARRNPSAMEKEFGADRTFPDPRDEAAALELEERINVGNSLYMAPFWDWVLKNHPEDVPELRNRALFDTLQEWRFVLGLLMVLNSRNVVGYSAPITFEKVNKARKAKGAPILHPHREIRLGLSHVQRNRLGTGSTVDLMAHLVRGHFKVRRTGLFWWSPHVRGKGEAPVGQTYIVKAPPNPGINL
jgi:hypothetical protein